MTYTISYFKLSNPQIEQSCFVATSITDVRRAEIRFCEYYKSRHDGDEAINVTAMPQPNGNADYAESIDAPLTALAAQ